MSYPDKRKAAFFDRFLEYCAENGINVRKHDVKVDGIRIYKSPKGPIIKLMVLFDQDGGFRPMRCQLRFKSPKALVLYDEFISSRDEIETLFEQKPIWSNDIYSKEEMAALGWKCMNIELDEKFMDAKEEYYHNWYVKNARIIVEKILNEDPNFMDDIG